MRTQRWRRLVTGDSLLIRVSILLFTREVLHSSNLGPPCPKSLWDFPGWKDWNHLYGPLLLASFWFRVLFPWPDAVCDYAPVPPVIPVAI